MHAPAAGLADRSPTRRGLGYSLGFGLSEKHAAAILTIAPESWTAAYDTGGGVRDGAWVADATELLDLTGWPAGIRVIVRKERPHPGAQLRFTDTDGLRLTAFATNTRSGPGRSLGDLELRHRQRARAEDRIRCAKDTGLRNLPLKDFTQNQVWCQLVALACELTAWMQMLAFPSQETRRWEPKRLRLRLFSTAGRITRSARRTVLHLAVTAWANELLDGLTRLRALEAPT